MLSLMLFAGALMAPAAWAGGGLDPSYGGGSGIVHVAAAPLPTGVYRGEDPFAQKAFVSPRGVVYSTAATTNCEPGSRSSSCEEQLAVTRYWPEGLLDSSFGEGGTLIFREPAPIEFGVDAKGRLLTATPSEAGEGATIRRYTRTGTPDPSFGNGGQVMTSGIRYVSNLLVAGKGRTLLVGSTDAGRGRTAITRLLANGRPDRSFGKAGNAAFRLIGEFRTVAVAPSGAIYLTGSNCCEGFVPLVRVSAAGRVDTKFNARARAASARLLQGIALPNATAVLPRADGEVDLVGGSSPTYGTAPEAGFALRLRPNGTADSAFGEGGAVILPQAVDAAAAGPEDTTFALSQVHGPGPESGRVVARRLLASGQPDPGFGDGGVQALPETGSTDIGVTGLSAGGAIAFVPGFRRCSPSCPGSPYLVHLTESASSATSKGGNR